MYILYCAVLYLLLSYLPAGFVWASNIPVSRIQEISTTLPLAFEKNQGQADDAVKFVAQGAGYRAFLTAQAMFIALEPNEFSEAAESSKSKNNVVHMQFANRNMVSAIHAVEPLSHKTHYFVGNEATKHITDIPSYAKVTYQAVYPGIDVVYYGNQQQIEYDLLVAPGINPSQIRLNILASGGFKLSKNGELIAKTAVGKIVFRPPVAYQNVAQQKVAVAAKYVINAHNEVQFQLGKYDKSKQLIIDPIVSYATFLWGGQAAAANIATDSAGNTYVVGATSTTDLPVAPGYKSALVGATDAYVVKLDATGSKALYATYLGSRRAKTFGQYIAVDGQGSAYVVGTTDSASYPVTSGSYMSNATGRFLSKLNPAGNALAYSTFLPNSTGSSVNAIAVDGSGYFYLAGFGTITPTAGALQTSMPGGVGSYICKLNQAGNALVFASYFGSNGTTVVSGMATDASGNLYLAGGANGSGITVLNAYQASANGNGDAFAAKINGAGNTLLYATYLGGSQYDKARAISVNATGEAYLVGETRSDNFPVTSGVFQPAKGYRGNTISNGFITKLSSTGDSLRYSSYLGGNWCSTCSGAVEDFDKALTVAVDQAGFAYVGGTARSPAFWAIDAIQDSSYSSTGGSGDDVWPFLAKVSPSGNRLIYSTLIGKSDLYDRSVKTVVVDPSGTAHIHVVQDMSYAYLLPVTQNAWVVPTSTARYRNYLLKIAPPQNPTTLFSSLNPAMPGNTINFTVHVESAEPNGTVTILDNGVVLNTVAVVDGVATFSTTLTAGIHRMTASYSVDGKESPPVFQVVSN